MSATVTSTMSLENQYVGKCHFGNINYMSANVSYSLPVIVIAVLRDTMSSSGKGREGFQSIREVVYGDEEPDWAQYTALGEL